MYVDNNVYDTESGWQRVNHNCHGVNNFREESHIAILSAINYDNLATAFLVDMAGMTSQQVRRSLIGEIAHQVIMRGSLRSDNANECHVYLMDMDLAAYLMDNIFLDVKYEIITNTARPDRGVPLTPMQRKKATLIRRNFSEYAEMPTDKLLKEGIWTSTNTNGKYSKSYLEMLAEYESHEMRKAKLHEKSSE